MYTANWIEFGNNSKKKMEKLEIWELNMWKGWEEGEHVLWPGFRIFQNPLKQNK